MKTKINFETILFWSQESENAKKMLIEDSFLNSTPNRVWQKIYFTNKFLVLVNKFHKTCMQNLSFLDSLKVAQKFVVEVPEIIRWGARDYMVSKIILVISLSLS